MIKPLVIIGVNDENNQMTVTGPDCQNKKEVIISMLADAIKIVSASDVKEPSSIVTPGKRF